MRSFCQSWFHKDPHYRTLCFPTGSHEKHPSAQLFFCLHTFILSPTRSSGSKLTPTCLFIPSYTSERLKVILIKTNSVDIHHLEQQTLTFPHKNFNPNILENMILRPPRALSSARFPPTMISHQLAGRFSHLSVRQGSELRGCCFQVRRGSRLCPCRARGGSLNWITRAFLLRNSIESVP